MKFILLLGFCFYVSILVENVSSRPQSLLGGFSEITPDSENVKQLALFSLSTVAQQSGSQKSLELIRVVSAKSQVVAGTNYNIKLLACEKDSTNEKNSVVDQKSCRMCDVAIWEQSWLNKKTVTDVACSKPSELASYSSVTKNN